MLTSNKKLLAMALFNFSNFSINKWLTIFIFHPLNIKLLFFWLYVSPRYWKKSNTHPKKIVVIRLDKIGDFILTSPFLRELREFYPTAHITFICQQTLESLSKGCPYIDRIIYLKSIKTNCLRTRIHLIKVCKKHFWKSPPEMVILPKRGPFQAIARMMAYFTKGNRRIGYLTERISKGNFYKGSDLLYLNEYLKIGYKSREVYYNLFILWYLGKRSWQTHCELWVSDLTKKLTAKIVESLNKTFSLKIALGIGGSYPAKCWSLKKFAALVFSLNRLYSVQFLLFGDNTEIILGSTLKKYFQTDVIVDYTGKTTLEVTAGIISLCDLYIGSDSCIKHMAATYRLPIVEIQPFPKSRIQPAFVSPLIFRPYQTPFIIFQPDNLTPDMIDNVDARDVLNATIYMIKKYCKK